MDVLIPTLHPELAWLVNSAPLWLMLATMLFGTLLLRGQLVLALRDGLETRANRQRPAHTEASLHWNPPTTTPTELLLVGIGSLLLLTVVTTLLVSVFAALVVAPLLMVIMIWGVLRLREGRYKKRLDDELPAAVGKLASSLRANEGLQNSIKRVVRDLPATSPLRAEWTFLIEKQGSPLDAGGMAGIPQVVAALLVQTPSERHRTFLGHLESVLNQDQNIILARVNAAYFALNAAKQRESAAQTQLAQMFYSGLAIGGAGIFMALYLAFTQWSRFIAAYSGPLGLVAGVFVSVSLAAPVIGGFVLSQAEDIDY